MPRLQKNKKTKKTNRIFIGSIVITAILIMAVGGFVVLNKLSVYQENQVSTGHANSTSTIAAPAPFPISVNPSTKTISTSPYVDTYLNDHLAGDLVRPVRQSWCHRLTKELSSHAWYQSLASPISRILVIWPGDRKEEVVGNFSTILRWDKSEQQIFLDTVNTLEPTFTDGTLFPGRYVVDKDISPNDVAIMINERFTKEVRARYPESIETIVPLTDAITIASLLEREAYDFEHMRLISGVIWNRLFIDMPLQLDATLQYVKGESSTVWWPSVKPDDKYIKSPYNTYQEMGLPPGPIANPSAAAILAALNPIATDCLFYFHDEEGVMYCSKTYDEHVSKLKERYGQGQ